MREISNLLLREVKRLHEDYDKCENLTVKKQIKSDILLLREALTKFDQLQ